MRKQPLSGDPVARACVVGASGFAGALSAALLWSHPRVALEAVTARSEAGRRLDELYPRYRVPLELEPFDAERLAGAADVALVSYPHGAAAAVVAELRAAGLRVVDLSADFRLHDLGRARALVRRARRARAARRGRVRAHRAAPRRDRGGDAGGEPGLLLDRRDPRARAARARGPDRGRGRRRQERRVGRGPRGERATHFVSVAENVTPYAVEGHRHAPEIDQELAALGHERPVTFMPHLLPLDQGLLASCYVTPARELSDAELAGLYRDAYERRAVRRARRPRRPGCATCATRTSAASTSRPRPTAGCSRSRRSTTSGRAPPARRCRT